MRLPFSPFFLLLFIVLLVTLVAVVQVGLMSVAFDKLGLSPGGGLLLLAGSLLGSVINLPLFTIAAQPSPELEVPPWLRGLLQQRPQLFAGRTLIAINVGGGLIPLCFSLYLIRHTPITPDHLLMAIGFVTAISYLSSRPVAGLGIAMPLFIGPLSAAAVAVLLDRAHSAPLAYICGTLGVLLGADLLRLPNIRQLGTPLAAIGGAGTFDGIFLTGIVAVLLA